MNRYDFIYLFDVKDANPNGDPDAGQPAPVGSRDGAGSRHGRLPQAQGPQFRPGDEARRGGFPDLLLERAVLNRFHEEAYTAIGEKPSDKLPKDLAKARKLTSFMCKNFFYIRAFGLR